MDFTLYTFGDVEIMRAALAGVAMVFSPDGFFTSSEGIGLGAMAGLGLLITLIVMLVNGVVTQKVEVGQFIVLISLFFVMFVPKVRVQVEDYYSSGQIAAVDNVPMGVGLTVATISGITRAVNDRMATGYQTVTGSAYVNMTSPLKMLFGLRRAARGLPSVATGARLRQSLQDYAMFCLAGRPEFEAAEWDSITIKTGVIEKMMEIQTTGITLNYLDDPLGVPVPCQDMKGILANAMKDFYANSYGLERVLNGNMANTVVVKNGMGQPATVSDYEDAFKNITNGSTEAAAKFAYMTIFNPYIMSGLNCAYSVADKEQLAQCLPMAASANQYAEDAAAGGTFFQRLMFHSMNFLLFMFICLAPLVAVMMMVKGWAGLKVLGGYLLFGAWSQSWFIGATIVNFYIQQTLLYELTANGGIDNFTYQMIVGGLFPTLQDKMALAGNMVASTPLMMMAIMGGSAYGLVGLASKHSGTDTYNERVNSTDAVGAAPMASRTAMANTQFGGPSEDMRFSEGSGIMVGYAAKWHNSQSIESQRAGSHKVMDAITNTWKHITSNGTETARGVKYLQSIGVDDTEGFARASKDGTTAQFLESVAKNKAIQRVASAHLGGGIDIKAGTGTIKKVLAKGGKAGEKIADAIPDVNISGQAGTKIDNRATVGGTTSLEGKTGTNAEASLTSDTRNAVSEREVLDEVRQMGRRSIDQYGKDMQKAIGDEVADVHSYVEKGALTTAQERIYGGEMKVSAGQMLNSLIKHQSVQQDLAEAEARILTGAHEKDYRKYVAAARREYQDRWGGGGKTQDAAVEALARMKAMERVGALTDDKDAKEAFAAAILETSGGIVATDRAASMRADSHKEMVETIQQRAGQGATAQAPDLVKASHVPDHSGGLGPYLTEKGRHKFKSHIESKAETKREEITGQHVMDGIKARNEGNSNIGRAKETQASSLAVPKASQEER